MWRSTGTRWRPLGLTVLQVEDALAYAYGSRQVSSIFAPTNQYQVILELDPLYQGDPAALGMLYIHGEKRTAGPARDHRDHLPKPSARWR